MKKKPLKEISTSVRAKLLNISRSTGRDFQELAARYTVERFLARMTISNHRDRFVLKGAMLYIPWKLDDKRTTKDLDLLGLGSSDMENIKKVFKEICETHIEDDGLIFNIESIEVLQIREKSIYEGVRILMDVYLEKMSIRLQVDVGFGDPIIPAPQPTEFPALFAEHGPVIRAYSPETVIAEKFNAMIVLGMANSRMKDYYDIWMLSKSFNIEANVLRLAIKQTFNKRQTAFPDAEPIALSDEFFQNESKQNQWKGFIRRQKRINSAPDLREIVKSLRIFLLPIVIQLDSESVTINTWTPENGWSYK
ncbi:MAG: nucleotidyl transferase AbiEii/AbiGii toxin family protein [Deltaproteobacteria bacterium]|nr:nucleotidyl transferase AbiEii/AbiGii toxin family protein [Deltaproteobacteria bacterium]